MQLSAHENNMFGNLFGKCFFMGNVFFGIVFLDFFFGFFVWELYFAGTVLFWEMFFCMNFVRLNFGFKMIFEFLNT